MKTGSVAGGDVFLPAMPGRSAPSRRGQKIGLALVGATLLVTTLAAGAAEVARPAAHDYRPAPTRPDAGPDVGDRPLDRPGDARRGGPYGEDDEIGLPSIAPSIFLDDVLGGGAGEPWPAQYQPDSYRLPDYDGKPSGPHFCRGPHGRSLSTDGASCPKGQKPDTGTRHLSTESR